MDIKLLQLDVLMNFGDEIDRLIESMTLFRENESKELQKQYQNLDNETELDEDQKWYIQENIIDEDDSLKEIEELSYELAIIALYKKIEITTKRAIKIIYSDVDQKNF